ncbi:MAG TPA: S8 family serine peptidase [Bacteroidia bacterium]|nr:S8 family serine peptidase [Bacteroidia bacterium]
MKKLYFLVAICLISAAAGSAQTYRLPASAPAAPVIAGKLVFKVKAEYRSSCRLNTVDQAKVKEALKSIGAKKVYKKFPTHQAPESMLSRDGKPYTDLSRIYGADVDPQLPIQKAINALMATGMIEYAEPLFIMEPLYNPNDPDTASQYYLGLLQAYDAWDISKGDSNYVVGVTDTGTDLDHPDLAAGIKYNYADPINGIDDDNDGYIDNFQGWDLGDDDNDPSVDIVHGSFVCGFAGAVTDNGVGIAGPGFKTRFLPVKISSNGLLIAAYEGIVYAADHGCQVINCSWGSFGGGQYGQDIIDYATTNMGRLVVGAAGNSNNDAPFYPASYKGVLSVTATNDTDTKWVNSSYGSNVDVSAPGEAVYSTIFDNTYSFSSGTSFASPIVAACAALVWSANPFMSPLQIAEQLRATSDDINGVPGNAAYINQLGKGRVNLYRALTETPKSVRFEDIAITDGNDNAFAGGDTLQISGLLHNYLQPLSNLDVTLTCNSPNITILNGSFNAGAMATSTTLSNGAAPFTALINPAIPFNSHIIFTLTFSDGTYSDWQQFDLVVNVDYINMLVNDIGVSITSKGRIGYNGSGQAQGIGFTYNSTSSHLYEGGFLVGTDTLHVSNHLFDSPTSVVADDFYSLVNVRKIIPSVVSEFDLDSRYNDDGAGVDKLDVAINQHSYAWSTPADSKYVIVEYVISNQGTGALQDLYAGIYCDWDIVAYVDNRGEYDAGRKMGYAYNLGTPNYYTAVKQLNYGSNNCYAVDNDGSSGSISIYDGFSTAEKYMTMSTPRLASGQAANGNDISMMVASGPHSIAPGDSITVAFALIGGETLSSIQASADAAQDKYNTLNSVAVIDVKNEGLNNVFPNPFSNTASVEYSLLTDEDVLIEIYDELGRKVAEPVRQHQQPGTYTLQLDLHGNSRGIYYCKMMTNTYSGVVKLLRY